MLIVARKLSSEFLCAKINMYLADNRHCKIWGDMVSFKELN